MQYVGTKLVGFLAAAAIVAPVLIAFTAADERIAFSVTEGTSLEKTFTTSSNLRMENFEMRQNGNPPPMDMDMDMTVLADQTIEVVDEYAALAADRPSKLTRRFATLQGTGSSKTSSPMVGEQEMDVSSASELEGLSVVFTWDAGDEAYDVRFAEDQTGDAKLLEDLKEDMDLRALLPTKELAVGESYDIAPAGLVSVFAPGGNLRFKADDAQAAQMGMGGEQTLADMIGELRGTATGELTAVREIEGRRVAVLRIAIDVESDHDMTDQMREIMAEAEMPEGMEMDMDVQSADVELTLDLEGELLWDLAGGHFHSLELSGDVSSTVDITMTVEAMGQTMNIEQSVTMSGTQQMTAQVVRR